MQYIIAIAAYEFGGTNMVDRAKIWANLDEFPSYEQALELVIPFVKKNFGVSTKWGMIYTMLTIQGYNENCYAVDWAYREKHLDVYVGKDEFRPLM